MNMQNRWTILTLFFFIQPLMAQDYYGVIGLSRGAPAADIRRQCVAKTFEANNTLEQQKRQKQAALDQAKKTAGSNTAALEKEIADLHQQITFIKNACEILQDPRQKENYDATLAGIIAERMGPPSGTSTKTYEPGLFGKIKKNVDEAKKDTDVKVMGIVGNFLASIPLPDVALKIFNQNLALRDLRFVAVHTSATPLIAIPTGFTGSSLAGLEGIDLGKVEKIVSVSAPGLRKGLGFTGTMNFNNFIVKGTMITVEDTRGIAQFSFAMDLPENFKISSMFPQFKKLDSLSLPQGKFVVSTFRYTDSDGYLIEEGFNFNSRLELSGPLKALNDLKNKARELNSIIVRLDPILFQGIIPRDITKSQLQAVIPLRLGVDFTKIPKMPRSVSDVIKEITTDDFVFRMALPATFGIEAGARLVLGTQTDPLRLGILGSIDPQVISFGIRLRNMLELKFIALGNAGIQFDMDQSLMPVAIALGVPFTGVGVNGEIDLGTAGDHRVNLKFSGGVRVSGTSIPDLVLEAEASNLHFANIINLITKVVAKTGVAREIPADKFPVMNIDKLKGYLVLEDTKIAGKTYDAGFGLTLDAQLFDHKFGFAFDIKHKKLLCTGIGYMSKIDLFLKGKRIITFSGPGMAGITTDGPVVACNFDFSSAQKIAEGTFILKSLFEIPPLDLKVKTDLEIKGKSFKADFEATYVGFTTVFGMSIDPAKWQEMYLRFGFKGDFEKFLSEQARPALVELKQEAAGRLAAIDAKIGDLSRSLQGVQQQGISDTDREIERTRTKIRELEGRIRALRSECDNASAVAKLYICPKVGGQLIAPGTELTAQKTYLEGLLKPGRQVIRTVTGAASEATKAISDAQIFKKSVTGLIDGLTKAIDAIGTGSSIIKVTEAVGEVSAKDLGDGKLPKLISFVASVNIPDVPSIRVELKNLQFDFKNPRKTCFDIAKKLITAIKIG